LNNPTHLTSRSSSAKPISVHVGTSRWAVVATSNQEQKALSALDAGLARIADREQKAKAKKAMWLAHHWPEHYQERCAVIGGRHVCRRCSALYPLGILVAIVSAAGYAPWPESIDPWPIWLLSIPATIAYCAEAMGWLKYSPKVQVGTTLVAAVAFGRALGYEFQDRWSSEFWGPIAVFGGIWFLFTMLGARRRAG